LVWNWLTVRWKLLGLILKTFWPPSPDILTFLTPSWEVRNIFEPPPEFPSPHQGIYESSLRPLRTKYIVPMNINCVNMVEDAWKGYWHHGDGVNYFFPCISTFNLKFRPLHHLFIYLFVIYLFVLFIYLFIYLFIHCVSFINIFI